MKPYCSASSTRRGPPTFAPSGANTELQEWAKESVNEPPHDSPLAFSSSTPSSTAAVWTGNSSLSFTAPSSRPAVVVTILNVEPGGPSPE